MEANLLNTASIPSKIYDRETLQGLTLTACKRSGYPDIQDKDIVLSENQNQVFVLKIHGEEKSFSDFFKSAEELSSALLRPFYENFGQDIQTLLVIKSIISSLSDKKGASFNKNLALVGNLCSNIYRRDINETCIRNLKSNSCLDLNAFEILEFVQENLEISDDLRSNIVTDFANLSESIDFCIWSEWGQPRLEKFKESLTKQKKEVLLPKIYSWKGSQPPSPRKLLMNGPVKKFIASYYVPICFRKMEEILKGLNCNEGLKFDSIEERYHFARSFVQIGEMCRSVRYVAESEKGFVRTLNEIRNYIKNPKTHQNIFVKWTDMNHTEKKFDDVLKKVSELRAHIEDCIQEIFTKKEHFNLKNLLSKNFEFLQELEKQLEPRGDPVKRELLQSLNNIKGKLEKETKIVKLEFNPNDYNDHLSKVSEADRGLFELPTGDLVQIQSYSKKLKCAPSAEVRKVLNEIRAIQKRFGEDGLEEEITKLIEIYRMQYNKASQKYQGRFPKPEKEHIKSYISQQEKKPNEAVEGEKTEKDEEGLTKLSENFIEESQRLKNFLKNPLEQKQENINIDTKEKSWKIIRNNAVLHSIGILGEIARYLIENDEKYASLAQFSLPCLHKDLDKTRALRNDLMHRILIDKGEDVLHTIYRNILPALPEIEAINRVLNQELIYDKSKVESLFSLGDDCFLLGKYEDGYSYFEQAIIAAISHLPGIKKESEISKKDFEAVVELMNVVRRIAQTYSDTANRLEKHSVERNRRERIDREERKEVEERKSDDGVQSSRESEEIKKFKMLKLSYLEFYLELHEGYFDGNGLPKYLWEAKISALDSLAVTKTSLGQWKEAIVYHEKIIPVANRIKVSQQRKALYLYNFATAKMKIYTDPSEREKLSTEEAEGVLNLFAACLWEAHRLFAKNRLDDDVESNRRYLLILGEFTSAMYMKKERLYARELHEEFLEQLKTHPERETDELKIQERYLERIKIVVDSQEVMLTENQKKNDIMFFEQKTIYENATAFYFLESLIQFYEKIGHPAEEAQQRYQAAVQAAGQLTRTHRDLFIAISKYRD